MAWYQKISRGIFVVSVLLLFIACRTQYPQNVNLFETIQEGSVGSVYQNGDYESNSADFEESNPDGLPDDYVSNTYMEEPKGEEEGFDEEAFDVFDESDNTQVNSKNSGNKISNQTLPAKVVVSSPETNKQLKSLRDSLGLILSALQDLKSTIKNNPDYDTFDDKVLSEEGSNVVSFVAYYGINKKIANNIDEVLEEIKNTDIQQLEKVYLNGYTDGLGTFQVNRDITNQRIAKIHGLLLQLGISNDLIYINNYASRYALKPVSASERRVEIKFIMRQ